MNKGTVDLKKHGYWMLREKGGHGGVIGRGVINSSTTNMQVRVRVIFVEAMGEVRR
jgi:hypothetical protein